MRAEIVQTVDRFQALRPAWAELHREARGGLFLSHRWLEAWWRAFRGIDQLWVIVLWQEDRLHAAWPLHLRAGRGGALGAGELRVLGDLGGGQGSLLARPGQEAGAAEALVELLLGQRGWDALEVPVSSQAGVEPFEQALLARGARAERFELDGRPYVELPSSAGWAAFAAARRPSGGVVDAAYAVAELEVPHALDELYRLLRREWGAVKAAGPSADPQVVRFLSDVVPELHREGLARVGLVGLAGKGAIAADLVVRDGDRAVQLLRGSDPDHVPAGVSEQLTFGSIEEAVRRGERRFDLADEDATLRAAVTRVERLRAWNRTTVGRVQHGVESLVGRVRPGERRGTRSLPSSVPTALRALDRLRDAAPDVVQRAVARLAGYASLHLYRGELFVREVRIGPEVTIGLLPGQGFDALGPEARDELMERLGLQPSYCAQKWDRGDMVVVAEVNGRPAGIVWCARTRVYVPDLAREVRPRPGECYIHDVFVHPEARGRKVAPAMLDFLARELRARDVYRAWALIERSNGASVRAFERAAYTAVADVVYARVGLTSRLFVTPPDPEARAFLDLS